MPENKQLWHLNEEEQTVIHELIQSICIEDMPDDVQAEKGNDLIEIINRLKMN